MSPPARRVPAGMATTKEQRAAKRLAKEQDDLINKAYMATCSNIQIPMMKIPSIFVEGRKALAEGVDFEALKARVRAYVDTIAC